MISDENIKKYKKSFRFAYRRFLRVIGTTKGKTSRNLFKLFNMAFAFFIIILLIDLIGLASKDASFGTFGDFFGGVLNPILTFLTFMGLLITIVIQQKELRSSRIEFKGQKEALQLQQIEMRIQSFDNKFFQMLNLFNDIKKQLYLQNNEVFKKLVDTFKHITDTEDFNVKFIEINNQHDTTFKYFFLNLYQLLNYIDMQAPSEGMKKNYANIIRAQLSKNELILLFYNCIGIKQISGRRYIDLVNKYEFFEHATYKDLFDEWDEKSISKSLECLSDLSSSHQRYAPDTANNRLSNKDMLHEMLNIYNESVFGKNKNILEKRKQQ